MVKRDRNRRPKRKVCSFCADKIEHIDYKDVAKLRRFITERVPSASGYSCNQKSPQHRSFTVHS